MRDAELAVLGCMLMQPEETQKVYGCLIPRMFEDERLAVVYNCCRKLYEQRITPDPVTILSKLGDDFKTVVVECAEAVPSLSSFDNYINSVQDGWRQRTIVSKMEELLISGLDADGLTDELRKLMEEQQRVLRHQHNQTAKTFQGGMVDFIRWLSAENTNMKTGFGTLDKLTGGLARKGVTGISARPGQGKTTLALQMATQMSRNYSVLYQSLEMPREQIYANIFANALQIDSSKMRDRDLTSEEMELVAHATDILAEKFKLTIDDSDCATLSNLEENIIRVKPEVVFVDHLGLLTPDKAKQKRNEELAVLTRGLKQLAMKHNIAIVELIQASRSSEGKALTMADMFGSATIEHDADMLIGITPNKDATGAMIPVDVSILKNRHGAIGTVEFAWKKSTHTFLEVMHVGNSSNDSVQDAEP